MANMLFSTFQSSVLPSLVEQAESPDQLRQLITDYCQQNDIQLVDENGQPIDVSQIEIETPQTEPTVKAEETTEVKSEEVKVEETKVDEKSVEKVEVKQVEVKQVVSEPVIDVKAVVAETIKEIKSELKQSLKIKGINKMETEKKVWATARKYGNLKHFKGVDADEKAYKAGQWFLALRGNESAKNFCREHGINVKGAVESSNANAAYIVPDVMSDTIYEAVTQYGALRANADVRPMSSDVMYVGEQTAIPTAYFIGEATASTEGNATFGQITLTAKKIMCMSVVSKEMNEDGVINLADKLAGDFARAIAYKEDFVGFVADGTADTTDGSQIGIVSAMSTLYSTTDNGYGLFIGTGNAYSEITLGDITGMMARLPLYAQPNAKFYCHPTVWGSIFCNLASAAGGNTITTLQDGSLGQAFLGKPWVPVHCMTSVAANSANVVIYGDLSQSVILGDRRQFNVEVSDTATVGSVSMWDTDQLAIKGTSRMCVAAHNYGAAASVGGVVMLQLKGS